MKKKFLFFICILFAFNMFFLACDSDDDTPQVGVCLKEASHDWRKVLKKYAEKSLNQYGLLYSLSQSKNEVQDTDIIEMVNKGVEVLIIMPDGASEEAIASVKNSGIPIIFAEKAIGSDYAALVKIDNTDIGKSAGEFFNKQEDINRIVLFRVTLDTDSSDKRIEGIFAVLNENLKTNIHIMELTEYSSAAGKTAMDKILNDAELTEVDAIYAQDDEIANGVLQAIDAKSSDQIKAVVGCGGSTAFYDKIKTNKTINLATTLYSPAAFMEKSVEIANAVLKGNSPAEKIINLGSDLVDKDNVAEYEASAPY